MSQNLYFVSSYQTQVYHDDSFVPDRIEGGQPAEDDATYIRCGYKTIELNYDDLRRYDDAAIPDFDDLNVPAAHSCCIVPNSQLHGSSSHISRMLSDFSISESVETDIISKVLSKIHGALMESTDDSALKIGIDVKIVCAYSFVDATIDHVLQMSLDDQGNTANFVPASKTAIENLKRARYEGSGDEEKSCVICLEELTRGDEVTEIGCSHVYHRHCIVEWLSTSHVCPICRFKMPVEVQ